MDCAGLLMLEGHRTTFTDAFTMQDNDRRTHLYYPGTSSILTPEQPSRIVTPCLAHLDCLIINEFEAALRVSPTDPTALMSIGLLIMFAPALTEKLRTPDPRWVPLKWQPVHFCAQAMQRARRSSKQISDARKPRGACARQRGISSSSAKHLEQRALQRRCALQGEDAQNQRGRSVSKSDGRSRLRTVSTRKRAPAEPDVRGTGHAQKRDAVHSAHQEEGCADEPEHSPVVHASLCLLWFLRTALATAAVATGWQLAMEGLEAQNCD